MRACLLRWGGDRAAASVGFGAVCAGSGTRGTCFDSSSIVVVVVIVPGACARATPACLARARVRSRAQALIQRCRVRTERRFQWTWRRPARGLSGAAHPAPAPRWTASSTCGPCICARAQGRRSRRPPMRAAGCRSRPHLNPRRRPSGSRRPPRAPRRSSCSPRGARRRSSRLDLKFLKPLVRAAPLRLVLGARECRRQKAA
jgi:hypothetical protein